MWLVGCAYHFCWLHESLRIAAPARGLLEVAGAHASDGRGPDESSVDDAGAEALPRATPGLGST